MGPKDKAGNFLDFNGNVVPSRDDNGLTVGIAGSAFYEYRLRIHEGALVDSNFLGKDAACIAYACMLAGRYELDRHYTDQSEVQRFWGFIGGDSHAPDFSKQFGSYK